MSRKPRILILGANGQLGSELHRSFGDVGEVLACGRVQADLTFHEQLRTLVRETAPDLILNAAAYTAVDRAESEPEMAMAVNAHALRVLGEEAHRAKSILVHYSTDFVFDGSKPAPWTEDDPPDPLNVYGASKLAGEEELQQIGGQYLIFRTSWIYSARGHNFLLTILRLAREGSPIRVVDDQVGAPTSSRALADATKSIIRGIRAERFGPTTKWRGLYHMSCAGCVSRYEFAKAILREKAGSGKIAEIVAIPSDQYPTAAARPRNSVLSNEKLSSRFGIQLPAWEEALAQMMRQLSDGNVKL